MPIFYSSLRRKNQSVWNFGHNLPCTKLSSFNVCYLVRTSASTYYDYTLVKRKWERIVNRGFGRSNGIQDYAPPLTVASTATTAQGGAMLEGIREGVQGVSRLIAAGLGELSSVPAPSSPSLGQRPSRRQHSAQPSSSSVSTYTTNVSDSTRLSQSSASSLGDESTLREGGGAGEKDTDGGMELLMVRDTGENPTPNASPALERMLSDSSSDIDNEGKALANERTMKIHKRKSRGRANPPLLPFPSNSFDPSTITDSTRTKRPGTNGLPPVASIPGVGSLIAVSSSGDQPVASWVDSVGKKWEEIQRGHTYVLSSTVGN